MPKEAVNLNLMGIGAPEPYRGYIRQRNGVVARNIALYLSLPYMEGDDEYGGSAYQVPGVTQIKNGKTLTPEDFYGLMVTDPNHVGKAILHPSVSDASVTPHFHSDAFQSAVSGLVLPGYTAFSKDDALAVYEKKTKEGVPYGLRLKLANESDGLGQYPIENEAQLREVLAEIPDAEVCEKGIVFEANLNEPETVSVGYVVLGGDRFSFIARQRNDKAPEDGRSRYRGASISVVNGGIEKLGEVANEAKESEAVAIAGAFDDRYSYFDPVASRLSLDVLSGKDDRGNEYHGVTDITGRLGGSCPALSLAVLEFKQNPGLAVVHTEVNLNYDPTQSMAYEEGAVPFIDVPDLRLTAKVNSSF